MTHGTFINISGSATSNGGSGTVIVTNAPSAGQVLEATSATAAQWQSASGGTVTLSGDVTGASNANTVVNLAGSSNLVTVTSGTAVAFGTNPSATGLIRMPTASGSFTPMITTRNHLNTLDMKLISSDTSDDIFIGDGNNASISIESGSEIAFYAGGDEVIINPSNMYSLTPGGITLGSTTFYYGGIFTAAVNVGTSGIGGFSTGNALAYQSAAPALTSGTANSLTAAQYSCPQLNFTGTLSGTGTSIVFPATNGAFWICDFSAIVFGGHSLTLTANSHTWGTTVSAGNVYLVSYSSSIGKLIGVQLTA